MDRAAIQEWGGAILLRSSTALTRFLGAIPATVGAIAIVAIESRGVCWNLLAGQRC